MAMPGARFDGVRRRPPATPALALVMLVATLSDVVCKERDVAHGAGSGGAKQRDCSHLSGRQLSDCNCRVALERTKEAWGRGDVGGAGRASMDCDMASPGLVATEKALLKAVRDSARHAENARGKIESGLKKEAIREYQALFKTASAFGTPWAKNYTSPTGLALCRLWAKVVQEDLDVSETHNAELAALAGPMLEACAGAFAYLKASPRRAPATRTVAQRVVSGLRFWKREKRRGSRDEGGEGVILGAQVACFGLMKNSRSAIAFARRHGFRVQRVRRNGQASGDWADRAFSDGDLRRGGVDWIKGADETPAPEEMNYQLAWKALKRVGESISQVYSNTPRFILPNSTAFYAEQVARAVATDCFTRFNFSEVGKQSAYLLRKRQGECLRFARSIHYTGALKAEIAWYQGETRLQAIFLQRVDQALMVWPRWMGEGGLNGGGALPSIDMIGILARRAIRLATAAVHAAFHLSWVRARLKKAAASPGNTLLLAHRVDSLLALGDTRGAHMTAEAMAMHDASGRGQLLARNTGRAVAYLDCLARAARAQRKGLEDDTFPEEEARRVLAAISTHESDWKQGGKGMKVTMLVIKARAQAVKRVSCETAVMEAQAIALSPWTLEAVADCHRWGLEQSRSRIVPNYLVAVVAATQLGFPANTAKLALNCLFVKIFARSVRSVVVYTWQNAGQITSNTLEFGGLMLRRARRAYVRTATYARRMWRTVREYLATAARDRRNASGPGGGRRKPPPRPPNPPPESEEQTGQKQRRSWFGRGCRRPYKNMMDLQLVHTFGGAGGIMKGCTKSTARKAYHKLSLEYHPDKANERGLDKKCSEENFIDIQQAYERAKDLCR